MRSVLSSNWYTDPRILEAEERRLFQPSWQYVGPLECVRRPGDQMVGRLLRVPVVVVADGDGELRGFLNVCRHRGSVVVAADGNAPRLRCPYHAWTYGLDGPPLEEVTGDLAEVVAGVGLDLGGLRRRQRFGYTLPANWKIHLENYLECYHCPVAHPGFSAVMEVGPGRYELTAGTHRLSHRAPVRQGTGFAAGSVTAGSYHLLLPNVKININPGRQKTCPSGRSIRTVPAGPRGSSTTTSARTPTRPGSRK